jgi:hypothetical protein
MSTYIKLVHGDVNNPQVQATLTDDNTGAVIDLTTGSPSCVLKFRAAGSTTLIDTLAGSITDASGGVVVFPMGTLSMAGDPGDYEGQITVTWASGSKTGKQSTYAVLRFRLGEGF